MVQLLKSNLFDKCLNEFENVINMILSISTNYEINQLKQNNSEVHINFLMVSFIQFSNNAEFLPSFTLSVAKVFSG